MNNSPQRDLFLIQQQAKKAQTLLYLKRDLTKEERESIMDTLDFMLATLQNAID